MNDKRYKKYLLDMVHSWSRPSEDEELLLIHLYNKEFYSYIGEDEAREEDGMAIRDGIISSPLGPCKFLEFLIGVAFRMDYFCTPPELQPLIHFYFWRLIKNLDLLSDMTVSVIDEKIDRFMSRSYDENGEGGLFPLRHPKEDQRNVPIWYQMSAYIDEHPRLYEELVKEDDGMWNSTR